MPTSVVGVIPRNVETQRKEGGEWGGSAGSPGSHILTDDMTITVCSGGPAGG